MDACAEWAEEVFGGAELGDSRRTRRLVRMAAEVGRRPSGKIAEVYTDAAERQGAYDFVESDQVDAEAISRAVADSTAQRCAEYPWVYVAVDGTSIKLWDGTEGGKDFGSIGTYRNGATGLKVNNALALCPKGVPIGLAAQVWWNRPRAKPYEGKRPPSYTRRVPDKETRHLIACIDRIDRALARHAPKTQCWFQMDRGCDAQYVLMHLAASRRLFTVRSQSRRRMLTVGRRKIWLKNALLKEPSVGQFALDLPETETRAARRAVLNLRAKHVTLRMRDNWARKRFELPINVVSVEEIGKHHDRVEWILLTNQPITTLEQIMAIVRGYSLRWRIEEFHKTLKTGACNIEELQLRSSARVIRWATILSAVAARIERLKHLARTSPDLPASQELSKAELLALLVLKRRRKRANEVLPEQPTISDATRWIAELGGYTGKSSGGPPGTITIGRGLERLSMATEFVEAFEKIR
jgi:hypothetical protein